ncbi:MAG: hypothetical protein ABL952_12200 [Pyrinomonadaceae bacterium]
MKRPHLLLIALSCMIAFGCQTSQSQSSNSNNGVPAASSYKWTQLTEHAAYPTGYNYPIFVAKGLMWAFHAESIWSSADGKAWVRSELPTIRKNVYQSQYVQFKDAIYALGDNSGNYEKMRFNPKIRRTRDFKKWETLAGTSNLPGRIFYGLVVFRDKIWLIGGYDGREYHNDVWNSADGVVWTNVAEKAAWSARNIGTITVFRDKIFIIGGGTIDGMPNPNPDSDREVWTSSDGVDWNKETTDLQKRAGGSPVVFDNKLWLVGANRDGSFARSSLVSEDGVTFKEESAPWSPRGGAAGWVFNDKMYMTGGKYSITENGQIRFIYSNDVWVMSKK